MTTSTRTGLESYALLCKPWISDGMLPYWRTTGIDPRYGGYRLRDYGSERWARLHRWRARQHASKHLMSQSRLVWVFTHAQLAGFTDGSGADLEAARNGYAVSRRPLLGRRVRRVAMGDHAGRRAARRTEEPVRSRDDAARARGVCAGHRRRAHAQLHERHLRPDRHPLSRRRLRRMDREPLARAAPRRRRRCCRWST